MSHPPLTFFISGADVAWMRNANCQRTDPDRFHQDEWTKRRGLPAEVPPDVAPICGACEVRIDCLAYALQHDEYGVWGGTTRQQREAMQRPIVRAKCPACQSANLFQVVAQQVCGDCGASWQATKIHGNARASVTQPVAGTPVPMHPGNVVRLPAKWTYEQPPLFDWARFQIERVRVRCSRRLRKMSVGEQLPLPGVAVIHAGVSRQARTKPVAAAAVRPVAA